MVPQLETSFSDVEVKALKWLASQIIPSSDNYNLPGADDPNVFAEILRDAARLRSTLHAMLTAVENGMDVTELRRVHAAAAVALQQVVVFCYYRDPRVMRALDMDARPPFPEGFEVEPGDLSLLEPVKNRGRMYRQVP